MNSAAVLEILETEQHAGEYSAAMRRHIRAHLVGTNVNATSLLTTDYLNHYSSMVMLLEQMPETPEELIIYLLAWEPVSYEEHFETSGFRDADLAKLAYRHSPENIRKAFDRVIDELHDQSVRALDLVRKQAEDGNAEGLAVTCIERAPALRELIDEASSIVNQSKSSQNNVDQHFSDL